MRIFFLAVVFTCVLVVGCDAKKDVVETRRKSLLAGVSQCCAQIDRLLYCSRLKNPVIFNQKAPSVR